MKRHTQSTLWAAVAFATLLSACGGKATKIPQHETETDSALAESPYLKTLHMAEADVIWIQDNAEEKLMPRNLFADASDSLVNSLSLQNGIPSTVSTFLVRTKDGHNMLFDTGLGNADSRLLNGLKTAGVTPSEITILYLTHFHGDHIGGMMKGDSVVFPNAEVYASKTEYDAWMNMPDEQKSLVVKTMEAYKDRLHLFEFGDTLPGNVVALNAIGHTPGHTIFQTGKLLIVGDLMHGVALQMEHPEICASFDMDKETAIATRKRILKYASDNALTMAGMHFPAPAFIKME